MEEMSGLLHSGAHLPLIPPAPFSHTGRKGSLGVLMPRTSEGAQGLFKKPAPASHDRGVATLRLTFPFIAGQWSLLVRPHVRLATAALS